ncbi:MAG: FAD-dependent oxidoreductase [Paracoccaceae bacterium]
MTAKAIILAAGAARRCRGSRPTAIWSGPTNALQPKRMPKKLLVIGSGAIGIEFASFFNTLGADTTVVEVLDRVLPVEHRNLGLRQEELREAGDRRSSKRPR